MDRSFVMSCKPLPISLRFGRPNSTWLSEFEISILISSFQRFHTFCLNKLLGIRTCNVILLSSESTLKELENKAVTSHVIYLFHLTTFLQGAFDCI